MIKEVRFYIFCDYSSSMIMLLPWIVMVTEYMIAARRIVAWSISEGDSR
jgi:hypothetical protein